MRCASKKTLTVHTLTNNEQRNMSKTAMLSLLDSANTGADILTILDTLTAENVSGADDTEGSGSVIDF